MNFLKTECFVTSFRSVEQKTNVDICNNNDRSCHSEGRSERLMYLPVVLNRTSRNRKWFCVISFSPRAWLKCLTLGYIDIYILYFYFWKVHHNIYSQTYGPHCYLKNFLQVSFQDPRFFSLFCFVIVWCIHWQHLIGLFLFKELIEYPAYLIKKNFHQHIEMLSLKNGL